MAAGQFVAAAEHADAAVFQETADDRFHPDIVRKAGHARFQAADAAHDQINLHARRARFIEFLDDARIHQAVQLHPDGGRTALLCVSDFLVDQAIKPAAHGQRRHRQLFQLGRLHVTGDIVHHLRRIARQQRISGEERQIGIDARRDRMIIAGAEMHIGADRRPFAPDHHAQLGVRFPFHKTIYNLHAGAFQFAGPANILLLVKAGLQFDHRCHRFAGFGGIDQGTHDGAVLAGAIQRLLDGDHIGIGRSLAQEGQHHFKALIGVMNHQVLAADGSKAIAAMFTDALRKARRVRFELQIWPVFLHQQRQIVDAQHARNQDGVAIIDAQLALHQHQQAGRSIFLHGEMDHLAAAAALQRGLVKAHQIFGFFFHFDIGIADHPESAIANQIIAGEQLIKERPDGVFQADPAHRFARQPDEARQHRRQHQQRAQQFIVGLAAQFQDQRKALVGDERERVRRIDRLRGEHRENLIEEMRLQPVPLRLGEFPGGDDVKIGARQLLGQQAPHPLLFFHQVIGLFGNGDQLLRRCHALRAHRFDTGLHLAAQAGDAHHEKLIEVVA